MQMTVLRGMRIDQHPADGVTHAFRDLAIVLLATVQPRMVVSGNPATPKKEARTAAVTAARQPAIRVTGLSSNLGAVSVAVVMARR